MSPFHLQPLTSSPPLLSPPPPLILASPAKDRSTHRFPPLPSPCSHHCLSFLPPPCPTSTPSNSDASPPWCITFPPVLSSCSPRCLLPLLPLCTTSTSSNQGSYHFLKDFQGPFSHFSRTPISAKKSLGSTSFSLFDNMKNFILKVFLCLLL